MSVGLAEEPKDQRVGLCPRGKAEAARRGGPVREEHCREEVSFAQRPKGQEEAGAGPRPPGRDREARQIKAQVNECFSRVKSHVSPSKVSSNFLFIFCLRKVIHFPGKPQEGKC